MRDGKLHQLWKEGNAYYFFGQAYKEYNMSPPEYMARQPATATAPGVVIAPTNPGLVDAYPSNTYITSANVHRIYAVDMDSGAVY
jgi:hypothetical protein